MEKLITYPSLRNFTYSNDKLIKGPVKGVVIFFNGLGFQNMFPSDPSDARFYAEKGLLYVVPYNNPWSWMNRQAVSYTDEIIDVLFNEYKLPEGTPIVSAGGSMGGLAALTYMTYSKRTPVRCVVNCPVCDLPYHYTEREDLPRTLYSAFYGYDGTLENALESASPLHLINRMPDADYYVFHCTLDKAVNKAAHSDRFIMAMKKAGKRISYFEIPEHGHCDLPEDDALKFRELCAGI